MEQGGILGKGFLRKNKFIIDLDENRLLIPPVLGKNKINHNINVEKHSNEKEEKLNIHNIDIYFSRYGHLFCLF